MKKRCAFLMLLILSIGFAFADVESLQTQKINSDVELKQVGADFTSCNITSVSYPNTSKAVTDCIMTKSGNEYNYTLDSSFVNVLGNYIVNGFCTNGSDDVVWAYDFEVTSTGEKVSLSNIIIVIVFLILAGIFLTLGYSFSKEHWMVKTFFNFCSVVMGILAVNSAKIIASESLSLGKMGNAGLTVMVVVFSIFFIYMFIYTFIEVIKSLKEKRGVRWE